ncbi:putative mitochondrial carnitine O-acetyltransferase [Trichomonascus vanleenenianus]|uniref:choline/carnitine O-acyltransferase n=1 Tax=Trichomonascus vanleenenianus TaxID=2268995 RepID=UPI003ECB52C0
MGITFANQDKLQKLPIPELEKSCERYLEVLKPLQSARDHAQTEEAVRKFLQGPGPQLQEKLIEYASSKSSYIEQFWYDSYLNYDNPVVLNLNPFFLLEDDSTPYPTTQVSRAATLTMSSLRFIRALRREELPADTFKDSSLCMYQYSRLFGSARIPTSTGCVMQSYNASKHIVVICRSQFYWFDVLDDNNDLIMSEHDIALNFQSIIEDAQRTPITEACKGAVGVLTTENRRIWAQIRDDMMNSETEEESTNLECLKKIDWALFVVCLDNESPESLSDLSRNMLCGLSRVEKGVQVGTCTNRWYDKLQIIVTKNARAGINFEHTGVDGHTVLRFVSDIYTDTILRFAKSINGQSPSLWATQSPDPAKRDPASFGNVSITPRKLEFVSTPELSLAMRFAETRLADLIEQNDFQALEFHNYGMNTIKQMGFSPDAFVQMAFQAAYYSLYGRVECTYEPAMTKRFLHGRTESIRSVSQESVAFVRKFCEDAPAAQKLEYLKRACQKHSKTTAACSQGMGQDRHLYALFCIWKRYVEQNELMMDDTSSTSSGETNYRRTSTGSNTSSNCEDPLMNIPPIYADGGWDKLSNVIISTSNCGNPSLKLFGFGPVSPEGYGIGYIIKDDSITICASSKHRQTTRFLDTLRSYFVEVKNLHKSIKSTDKLWCPTKIYDSYSTTPSTSATSSHFGRTVVVQDLPATKARQSEQEQSYLLGGYGYFDVGDFEYRSRASSPVPSDSSRRHHHNRPSVKEIGRKLRLAEY